MYFSFRMFLNYFIWVGMIANASGFLEFLMSQMDNNCPIANSFLCRNSKCIDKSKRCDGKDDCNDGSDEANCDEYLCQGPYFFKCKNEKCLSHIFQCDNENDCGDFSDEINCENFTISTNNNGSCDTGEWQCSDRLCIPEDWLCNGEPDCLDGSDETLGCSKTLPCDGFKCENGHCVPKEWRCDGSNDCNDNSDEMECDIIDTKNCNFNDRLFLCSNNVTCLKFSQVCNGIMECSDGSDEGVMCNNPIKNCRTNICPHDCFQFPSGPKCMCPKGYRTINDHTCEDINECEIFGICDQKCRNTLGSYECYCDNKYALQEDKKSCKVIGGEAMMVFSSKTEIRGYFLQSKVYFPVAKRLKQVVGVAFDGHHVYWTDIFSGHESIIRSLEDGSKKELLVTSGLGAPEDLAIDWITGNIYFTDSEMQHIGVCNNDGSFCTVLINKDIEKPRGIVLHPTEGEMFWSDWGERAVIARSRMDGTGDRVFVSNNIKWPNGLAIDYPNERLYWADAKYQTLESIRLDGTDRRIVLKGIVKHPYAIAVFEDKLYWSDWTTQSIQSCDKFTGKDHHTLIKEKKEYIYGIHIYHSTLKPRSDNPCATSFCSHLCLLSGREYSCACPQDMILSSDKHICRASEKKQILVIGGMNLLAKVEHQILGKHDVTTLPTIAKDIIALTYSSNNNTLYISDASSSSIIAMSMITSESKIIFNEDSNSKIVSLAHDSAGNNLYWCDVIKGTVEILSLTTMAKKILMHDMAGEIPASIALVPNEGVMFIAFKKTSRGYHIDRFKMDGTGRTHVVDQGLLGPITLFYEYGLDRIFWADAGTGIIETTSVEGDDRHTFRSLQSNPISLASLNKDVFWTSEKSRKLTWTDKQNNDYNRKITLDLPDNIDSLYLVSVTSRPVPPHPCHINNGNCSHICLSSGEAFHCACPLGMNLRPDNLTCYKPPQCFLNEFFCKKSDICIESNLVCNGHKDCFLGDDEENCPDHTECSQNEFRCTNGECIKMDSVCDKHYDCKDKSDEASDICSNDKYIKKCPENYFKCNSGTCIADRFVCDGQNDCYEGEDENNCDFATCKIGQFRCVSGACIPKTWECDNQFDCYDLSDEHAGCTTLTCSSDQFTCKNGRCIQTSLKCDNNDDCGDMSDEMNCKKTNGNSCNIEEFECISNHTICLPKDAVCNGTAECPQMEDEKYCTDCRDNEFHCKNGKCLISEWTCDGVDDCGDMSDEEHDLCSAKSGIQVPSTNIKSKMLTLCADGFRCKNGNCLDLTLVCNGQEDCYDGSDEHGSCNSSCQINSNPCDQKCVKTPSGPMCVCRNGYKLLGDGQTCVDVKECNREPPICSQLCTEMPGSFSCGCHEDFILRSDKRSCKSVGEPMSLIFIANNQIRRLNQSDNTLSILYSDDSPEITGLDVSAKEDFVYFSIKESGTIHRLNVKNFNREYMTNAGTPSKLAVDWITQNVYYVDDSGYNKAVKICNFNKKKFATLFNIDTNNQISAIIVDPIHKYLFYVTTSWWIFNSPSSVIYRRTLDGMKVTEILKSSVGHITGLAVDIRAKRLYFSDQHNGQISKIDYDGINNIIVASNLSKLYGLNLFEDNLFFLTHGGHMGKCRLFGDNRKCNTFMTVPSTGYLFALLQVSRQPSTINACDTVNCTSLCVPADAGAKCLCSDGKVVFQGESCDIHQKEAGDDSNKPSFRKHKSEKSLAQSASGSAIVGVVLTILVLIFAGLGYLYVRKRNTGKFNISMKFYNPMFGVQPTNTNTDSATNMLQPGEHEYCNPVHVNNHDMEAATNAILQKVNPLVNINE